jgi:hypothetical protein
LIVFNGKLIGTRLCVWRGLLVCKIQTALIHTRGPERERDVYTPGVAIPAGNGYVEIMNQSHQSLFEYISTMETFSPPRGSLSLSLTEIVVRGESLRRKSNDINPTGWEKAESTETDFP